MTDITELPALAQPGSYVVDSAGRFVVDGNGSFVIVGLVGTTIIDNGTVLQRGSHSGGNFSRRRFEELLAEIKAARLKAQSTKDAKAKRALKKAAQAATVVAKRDIEPERAIDLTQALQAAVRAQTVAAILENARVAIAVANDDDDETIMLLTVA